jgi:hypothetical protein
MEGRFKANLRVLGIVIVLTLACLSSFCQCTSNFSTSSENNKITISWSNIKDQLRFELFKIDGQAKLVQTFSLEGSLNSTVIKPVEPGTYLVKVRWGNGCNFTLGGLEGLTVKGKDNE